MMRTTLLLMSLITLNLPLAAQQQTIFTHADTLRGSITPQRAWWDVTFYDLNVAIHPEDSTISGWNTITYEVNGPSVEMQIDLMTPLEIDSVVQDGQRLTYRRDGNAFFVEMQQPQTEGTLKKVTVYYHGRPRVSERPPWEAGFSWDRDQEGDPWVVTTCQGTGASVWWPNKDHQSEEPDSMSINITVPDPMINVSNGRLRNKIENPDGTTTYSWYVSNPINNYNVAVNASDNYVHFSDTFQGEKGELDLDYWVMRDNLDKAKKQFQQVKPMLKCFERWFGPYPFYEDSFKIVETPHSGMEHQSAIAYGNGYENGYRGRDPSGTGWGDKFDFIIIHEAAHEWWGNNISTKDLADMWVHEGFGNYSENIYVECMFGTEAGAEYVIGTRRGIQNDRPIIPAYNVNQQGSGDMYPKGGNMLHTIRQIINDDARWRNILRGLNQTFRHQTVTTRQIESYISQKSGKDLSKVFDQYLRHTDIPVFEYYVDDEVLYYRWLADVEGFDMPLKVKLSEEGYTFIKPEEAEWKQMRHSLEDPAAFEIDKNFYVFQKRWRQRPEIKSES